MEAGSSSRIRWSQTDQKPTITEIISLNRLCRLGNVQGMEENRIPPKKGLYINLEIMRLRGRPGNRWQDGVREDG
jgi:hypothetical protein